MGRSGDERVGASSGIFSLRAFARGPGAGPEPPGPRLLHGTVLLDAADRSDAAISFGTTLMLAIAAVSVIGAVLVVFLYIGRNLIARLVGLEKTMTRLAAGDRYHGAVGRCSSREPPGAQSGVK